jgi:peptidoglycan/LPS O-acetylase OafA/YrhL
MDDSTSIRDRRQTERASPHPRSPDTQAQRFWLLDNLRGIASLSVVLFHYKHFYFSKPGALAPDFDQTTQPFYSLLAPFYNSGHNAVQLFFVISGFVFFFVYYTPLREQTISGFQYFVARFSRLYPLHIVTLLAVAIGQWIAIRLMGQFVVYPHNDLYHFILQLPFASHWGLQLGDSFNGPVWSLSVEVVVYFMFYIYATIVARYLSMDLGAALIAFGLVALISRFLPGSVGDIANATACFLAGGSAFLVWTSVRDWKIHQRLYALGLVGLGEVAALCLFVSTDLRFVLHLIVFPALVLFLAVAQSILSTAGKRFRVVGDISYAIYLLHFPVQLYIIVTAAALGISLDVSNPLFFLGFLIAVIGASLFVFYRLEITAQHFLRKWLLR